MVLIMKIERNGKLRLCIIGQFYVFILENVEIAVSYYSSAWISSINLHFFEFSYVLIYQKQKIHHPEHRIFVFNRTIYLWILQTHTYTRNKHDENGLLKTMSIIFFAIYVLAVRYWSWYLNGKQIHNSNPITLNR